MWWTKKVEIYNNVKSVEWLLPVDRPYIYLAFVQSFLKCVCSCSCSCCGRYSMGSFVFLSLFINSRHFCFIRAQKIRLVDIFSIGCRFHKIYKYRHRKSSSYKCWDGRTAKKALLAKSGILQIFGGNNNTNQSNWSKMKHISICRFFLQYFSSFFFFSVV